VLKYDSAHQGFCDDALYKPTYLLTYRMQTITVLHVRSNKCVDECRITSLRMNGELDVTQSLDTD